MTAPAVRSAGVSVDSPSVSAPYGWNPGMLPTAKRPKQIEP